MRLVWGVATTKTTLYLEDSLRERLKLVSVRRGTTLTTLLAEGAELVIARYQHTADRAALEARAARARAQLRRGLYEGPAVSDEVDAKTYGVRRKRRSR